MAIQFNLLLYGLRSLKEDILTTVDKNVMIFSIDYDLVGQKVFWIDPGAESIKWISMDTKRKGTVVKGMSHAGFILPLRTTYSTQNEMVVNSLNVDSVKSSPLKGTEAC